MTDSPDGAPTRLDPKLAKRLAEAARAHREVAHMEAAIANNRRDLTRLQSEPEDHAFLVQRETLHLHTSIMREHLERRLEPARMEAVQALLCALEDVGEEAFDEASRRLADPPPPRSITFRLGDMG